MRIRTWGFGLATVSAALAMSVLGERGWGQPREFPELNVPMLPPPLQQEEIRPLPPPPSAPVEVVPAPQTIRILPPGSTSPSSPAADELIPTRGRLTDGVDLLAPRLEMGIPSVGSEIKLAGKQEPAVSVEWIGPQVARLNYPLNCQILVRNTGPAAVHGVTVRQRLNAGVVCKRTDPLAATDQNDIVWTIGSLQPGQTRRIELQLVATQRGALDCQASVTFTSVAGQQVQVREPLLAVKMRVPEKAVTGDKLNVLFAVANPGDGVTEGIKIKAILPDGLECARGRVVDIDIGNLEPKETRTLQIPCTARASGAQKCTIVASAEGNLSATDQGVTEVLEARLDLAMQGPKLRFIDRHAAYQVKVSNPGAVSAPNVVLQEVVPAGFKFHAATNGGCWDEATKTVSWQLGELLPGQSREVTMELVAAAAGDHRLQAQVASSRGSRTEASTTTRVEGSSNLVIDLADVDDPVEVGGETAYEIRVANHGTKTETNLELVCTLPDHEEFKGAKSIAGMHHRLEGRDVIFDPLPRLAPRADVIYRVTVRGTQAGDARFRIRVRADGMSEPMLREESTRFYNDNVLPR